MSTEMNNTGQLTAAHLNAGYGKRKILTDLTLPEIKKGSVVSIVGPNGAGKSTLLRVLAGLHPAGGSLHFGEVDLMHLPPKDKARYLSFMPQMVAQDVGLAVIDAVISALKASPFDALDQQNLSVYERAQNVLERVGIEDLALCHLNELSGGQRQLASLARSIVREPAILLLDEPTSALDLKHQVEVMKLVRSFSAGGKIVIMVVHDLNIAMRWSDKILVMKNGALFTAGSPKQAITPQVMRTVYELETRIEPCSKGYLQVIVD